MTNSRAGFTIIELLTVVAIVGVLATIVGLKSVQSRDKALRAGMVADLRTLVSSQEGFFSANRDYAGRIGPREIPGAAGRGTAALGVSPGNAVTLRYRSASGWSATVTNSRLSAPPRTCGIFMGQASWSPNRAVTKEGVPACY
ncbi:MAG: prepilin-type N-terminal cleavage/methylation domain-containing protein [Gemmatimonadales bacterium]|nr:prepilin-type N-terminal cleavage/methylation domain-containing protein [Gemmatimonadales bacterium]